MNMKPKIKEEKEMKNTSAVERRIREKTELRKSPLQPYLFIYLSFLFLLLKPLKMLQPWY